MPEDVASSVKFEVIINGEVDDTYTKSIVPKYSKNFTVTISRMSTEGSVRVVIALNDKMYRVYNFDFANNAVETLETYPFTVPDSDTDSDVESQEENEEEEETSSQEEEENNSSSEAEFIDSDTSSEITSSEEVAIPSEPAYEPEEPGDEPIYFSSYDDEDY